MTRAPLTLLVLAREDDAHARTVPGRVPPEVRAVVGSARDLAAHAAEAEALFYCSGGAAELRALWPLCPRLRWMHTRPAGVDRLLIPELVESAVSLTNSRGVFSRALAEWALAAVCYFAKDLGRLRRSQAQGRWDSFEPLLLAGRTAGIVGLGDIGRACARLLRAAGLRTLGLRRTAAGADPDVDEVLPPDEILVLMARADFVVVALPLTPATRGRIGPREMGAMKREAVLVNVGRGATVDEGALVAALREGRIGGAALDVFEHEPLAPGHPFYALERVLLSPHCADQVQGWREDTTAVFLENLDRYLRGQPLRNLVDKRQGY